ncbi:hypothetical protein HA49_19810 [Tatumella morbirosei]|uniref:diguanylate cyclase n=1 Tax=Tatumella morbirosei TaxID=642227 RepID=A0A095T167_9GAMM|nr:GGDEF domain-containing protein [Tatumella morbirosei]KGD70671.1 hypothetical protein HA49_19810 [Tatumella morbirosei]
MTFRLFKQNRMIQNGIILLLISALLSALGSHLRLPMVLSLFWIVNAVIAGLFIRKPWLHTPLNYLFCYAGMVANDLLFSGWAKEAFTINFANILFIMITAVLLNRLPSFNSGKTSITNVMIIFPVCLLAALVSATWGVMASPNVNSGLAFFSAVGAWSSEQFSTGLLLLPLILTIGRKNSYQWRFTSVLPVIAVALLLLASISLGGPGSLTLPLPGLIWCALVLPVSAVCLITCMIGVVEIMLIYLNIITVGTGFMPSEVTPLISVRLGIAALALTPYMVAVSMDSIRSLNRQLAIRANYDFLTQLLSRSGLFDSLVSEPFRQKKPMGLILLDIDFFKSINDNFGHDEGDHVLREMSRRLVTLLGEQCRISRFGGEEFAIVLFDTDAAEIYQQAESVRKVVSDQNFIIQGTEVAVSVSIGTALEPAGSEDSNWVSVMNRLISTADRNLYVSKRGGRNQTSPAWLD